MPAACKAPASSAENISHSIETDVTPTRRAIATCAKKFNSANNAAALLAAMNIGFGPNDNPPTK